MRQKLALIIILSFLVSAVVVSQLVYLTVANVFLPIQVESPNSSVIYGRTVPLTFKVNGTMEDEHGYTTSSFSVLWIGYSLDGAPPVTIIEKPHTSFASNNGPPPQITLNLSVVTSGQHKIEVMASGYIGLFFFDVPYNTSSSPTYFTVDTVPPSISVLSLQNKTYTVNEVPLNFAVSKPTSWIAYSLDNQANVTMKENTTIAELNEGSHNVIIYANDTIGNMGCSETIYFNVAKQEPAFPTLVVIAVSSVAIVSVALIVYFKKRQHRKTSQENS